jgi:hypothetical protein
MKSITIIFILLLLGYSSIAQNVNPLYIKFEGTFFGNGVLKNENVYFNEQNNSLREDVYSIINRIHGGFPLRMITYNKRDYVEINQSELANYNVKTIEEIRVMLASKTETEQLNFWGALHEQQKLYIIEILPNGKAKIVKVWVDYIH